MSTTQNHAMVDRLALSARELAKLLDVSERHVWAMHADGRLGPQPFALGRAKRWYLEEIREWLAAQAPARAVWAARVRTGQGKGSA